LAIASEIIIEKNSQILAGYGENMIEGYGLEDGIGPLGIRVLIFKNENYSTALIVLDSNNAVPEIRERILEDAKNLGIDYCEVLTTDTHIVNGIKLGGRGYHPLGEVIPIEVVSSSVVQALKRAMLNLKEMEVSRVSTTFRSVKVMSNEFLEEASEKTFKSLKLFYITTLLTLITSGLITLFLSLL
jgi:putative membrane protein